MSEDPVDGIQGCDTGLSAEQVEAVTSQSIQTDAETFSAISNETRY